MNEPSIIVKEHEETVEGITYIITTFDNGETIITEK